MSKTLDRKNNFFIHLVLITFALICIIPVFLIIAVSFTSDNYIYTHGYSLFPKEISFTAYRYIFSDIEQILRSYMITTTVTVSGTVVSLWMNATMAYVISRKDYKASRFLAFYLFFTMLFHGGLVPTYILIANWLNMKDTLFALIIPALVSPWLILLLKGYFQDLPFALVESAKIDGASETRIFLKIIIPISKPALATVALFTVLAYWNDWWLSMLYIDNNKLVSLQYMLVRILQSIEFLNSELAQQNPNLPKTDIPSYSARMAMCLVAAGPMLCVFPFFQKYFSRGLTVGSVKG